MIQICIVQDGERFFFEVNLSRLERREMPGGHFLLPSATMGEYEEPVSENEKMRIKM